MKITSIILSIGIFLFSGCAHKPIPGSNNILELPNDSATMGCEFIKKSRVLNLIGLGHDMHVENAKILMINDVIINNGNAYLQHYLSAGFGEAGNASFSIYRCPKGYNYRNTKILKNSNSNDSMNKLEKIKDMYEHKLITKDEYDKKRKELLDNF
ncbi:SHOCT domain-containing protein [Poseidonibacter ostreae]|uniref:SHOCT domain-containing protein n=1 Tax=Poseidonibacter ostreae TaxID=2654171 RepID=A0A6L4WUB0_9BACT|nr:SHOCT domain-containing protein [Poseidonibacter ostreae]KAB7881185.1 hypothetical protein GA417_14370 [Poseidonibacter ostreae]KAB7888970.1 hypothetical protein GBG19_07215 [Poseidonibacter ostreae]KAB7891903.1 hypothetical protein GBG18_04765 [Poseidonibacter ostreae]